jgi:hypothetical protein
MDTANTAVKNLKLPNAIQREVKDYLIYTQVGLFQFNLGHSRSTRGIKGIFEKCVS